ncbi:MAG: hypothetical protein AAGB19_04730 [Cyanobacteria bacterium P01_F01_bin.3]
MSNLQQFSLRRFISLLFVPAGLGLFCRVVFAQSLPDRLLALALLIFCPELARMAKVDLDNVALVSNQLLNQTLEIASSEVPSEASSAGSNEISDQSPNSPSGQALSQLPEESCLRTFKGIVVSTIVLELLGFYGSLASLQWGGIAIIFSQLWFNLLAKVELNPQETPAVTSFGLLGRLPVLVANAVGLGLLAFWPVNKIRLLLSIALLILISLFLFIKYVLPIFTSSAEQNAS